MDHGAISDVEAGVREIMAEILDVDPAAIGEGFIRDDASPWDSMNHLRLVTALEEAFGFTFTMAEIEAMADFGAVRDCVAAYLQRR